MGKSKILKSSAAEIHAAAESESTQADCAKATLATIVILCFAGTMALMEKLWGKFYRTDEVRFKEVSGKENTLDYLADIIADESIPDQFTICPPNCVPCCELSDVDLLQHYVYVDKSGQKTLNSGLPMTFNKDTLVELMGAHPDATPEQILEMYNKETGIRPVEAGYTFGNIVTPVRRATPCENVVIEALMRKKFLTCSESGFNAIAPLLEHHAG